MKRPLKTVRLPAAATAQKGGGRNYGREKSEVRKMTPMDFFRTASDEQLAHFLTRIIYLRCDHGKEKPDCWRCPVSFKCATQKRAHRAAWEYFGRQKIFFATHEETEKNKLAARKGNGYAGTLEKEFRDTIPAELWQDMTITFGECKKEILGWLQTDEAKIRWI